MVPAVECNRGTLEPSVATVQNVGGSPVKVRITLSVLIAMIALLFSPMSAVASTSDTTQPATPQPVANYFATHLIPRLIDLYGSGNGVTEGIDFDETTTVGAVSRVYEWSPDFLAGKEVNDPARMTNQWVATVSLRDKILGLATVWINPSSSQPELASFDSATVALRVSGNPRGATLIRDSGRGAWFSLSDQSLVTLVPGTSGMTGTTTLTTFQQSFTTAGNSHPVQPPGVAGAALILGIVVLVLAIFVLLPVRKRSTGSLTDEDFPKD